MQILLLLSIFLNIKMICDEWWSFYSDKYTHILCFCNLSGKIRSSAGHVWEEKYKCKSDKIIWYAANLNKDPMLIIYLPFKLNRNMFVMYANTFTLIKIATRDAYFCVAMYQKCKFASLNFVLSRLFAVYYIQRRQITLIFYFLSP